MISLSVWRLCRPMSNHLLRLYSAIFYVCVCWGLISGESVFGCTNGLHIEHKLPSAYMGSMEPFCLDMVCFCVTVCLNSVIVLQHMLVLVELFHNVRTACLTLRFLYRSCISLSHALAHIHTSYIHCSDIFVCLLLKKHPVCWLVFAWLCSCKKRQCLFVRLQVFWKARCPILDRVFAEGFFVHNLCVCP